MTNVLDEHLVVAESVLDRESDAIGREDLRGDLSGPCAAGRFRRHDRSADRLLAVAERRLRAIDLHEVGAPIQSPSDHVADRAHAQDRDAH